MKKLKIALIITTLLVLVVSNAFWFLVWIDSSLNEKTQDIDIAYYQEKSEIYFDFIKEISKSNSRREIEQLLKSHYSKEFWSSENVLNTKDLKFIFSNGELVRVDKQTELGPNEKG